MYFQICHTWIWVGVCPTDTRIWWIRKYVCLSFVRKCLILAESAVPFRNYIPPLTRWAEGKLWNLGTGWGPHYKGVEWGHLCMGSTRRVTSARRYTQFGRRAVRMRCPSSSGPEKRAGQFPKECVFIYISGVMCRRCVTANAPLPWPRCQILADCGCVWVQGLISMCRAVYGAERTDNCVVAIRVLAP